MITKLQGMGKDTLVDYESNEGSRVKVVSGHLRKKGLRGKRPTNFRIFSTRVYVNRKLQREFTIREFSPEDIPYLREKLSGLEEGRADQEELIVSMEQLVGSLATHAGYLNDDESYGRRYE